MDRHPFDPVSFVFGVLFCAAGLIVLSGGSITDEGAVLLPAALIGLGVAVMLRGSGGDDQPE